VFYLLLTRSFLLQVRTNEVRLFTVLLVAIFVAVVYSEGGFYFESIIIVGS